MTDYERIGIRYSSLRRADPRIAAQIRKAIGGADAVVNVGSGTGNYEPSDCAVVAVDPSPTMMQQRARTTGSSTLVHACAEALPFASGAFDVGMATLTLHHWRDLALGLREMQRVSDRQVIMLFDTERSNDLWVLDFYPEIELLESERNAPSAAEVASLLETKTIEVLPIPFDCTDGFGGAYWGRPEAYLEPALRTGMSSFAQLSATALARGDARLRVALESGEWDATYGDLRRRNSYDCGYRLVIT